MSCAKGWIRNTVLDRTVTFTHWLREQYPAIRLFREVDHEMTMEYPGEKAEMCTPTQGARCIFMPTKYSPVQGDGSKPSDRPSGAAAASRRD